MRLTCPTCGAAYEIAESMIPAAGRHVQCASCHTRWFVSAAPRRVMSEEQVLASLEARPTRSRPVLVPTSPPVQYGRAEAIDLTRPEPGPAAPSTAAPEAVEPPPSPTPRREPVTLPATEPRVSQPGPFVERPTPMQASRLDLDPPTRREPASPPPRNRFARGLLLVLVPALLAFGAYRFHDRIVAQVPEAAPALDSYEAFIDDLREDVQTRIDAFRGDAPEPSEQVQ